LIATSRTQCSIGRAKLRILLGVDMFLLSDVLKAHFANEPDIEIVGETTDPANLLVAVGETQAHVVIVDWPSSGEVPGLCTHLMAAYPDLTVIGLCLSSDRNFVCRRPMVVDELPSSDMASVQRAIHDVLADVLHPATEVDLG